MKKLSNKEIVILLRMVKSAYINDIRTASTREGLCCYIVRAVYYIYDKCIICSDIPILIPKFNPIFCEGNSDIYIGGI